MARRYDPRIDPDPEWWLGLDEDKAVLLVEKYHRAARQRMPNLRVHAIIHAIVESQVALGDETPVAATLRRLRAEGLDRHNAIHAIGSALTGMIWEVTTGRADAGDDPNANYYEQLERLTAAGWLAQADE
jgi:hypothetical protein